MKFLPYEGQEPYVFISYSHTDQETVTKIIEEIYKEGYHVWYDIGISPGEDPFEYIAKHLINCEVAIIFLSSKSANSHYCKSEINFAISKAKNLICVLLEDFELPVGLEMQLQNTQVIFYYKLTEEEFIDKLFQSQFFKKIKKSFENTPQLSVHKIQRKNLDVADMDGIFVEDKTIYIPDDVTDICSSSLNNRTDFETVVMGKSVLRIHENAFRGIVNLKNVILNSNLKYIQPAAFRTCRKIENIESLNSRYEVRNHHFFIADKNTMLCTVNKNQEKYYSVPGNFKYLEPYAIEGEAQLECVEFLEGLKYISDYAFSDCPKLKSIMLPYSVSFISNKAFAMCDNIEIEGYKDTYVEKFCMKNAIKFVERR